MLADVVDLARGQPGVHADWPGARQAASEQRRDHRRAVFPHHQHAVARLHALITQPFGHGLHALPQLRVGQGAAAFFVKHNSVGLLARLLRQQFMDAGEGFCVRHR
ncbi:hypothetical protein D3C71_1820970 [compost metagenome]